MKFYDKAQAAKAAVLAVLLAPLFAFAQASTLPSGVATGISGAQASGTEVIGLLAAAGAAVWLISKVLKKFGLMM